MHMCIYGTCLSLSLSLSLCVSLLLVVMILIVVSDKVHRHELVTIDGV